MQAGLLLGAVLVPLFPAVLRGQAPESPPRPALVIAGPATLGLLIPVNARWSLRPDIAATRTTFKVAGTSSHVTVAAIGLSALYTRTTDDAFTSYWAPRLAISRTIYNDGSHADTWLMDGMLGANWALSARFGVFGEGGVRLTNVRPASSPGSNSSSVSLSLRSLLGVTVGL